MKQLNLEPGEYMVEEDAEVAAGWVLTFTIESDGRLTHVAYAPKDSAPGVEAMARVGEDTRSFTSGDEPIA